MAVKIIRNKKRFHGQALIEVKILQRINQERQQASAAGIVKMLDNFYFRNHLCITFELLDINLYEFVKLHQFRGHSLKLVRHMAAQILAAMQVMERLRIIHCDLKPENILLCDEGMVTDTPDSWSGARLQIIDFGSSCYVHERVYTYIQSRFYRSPEVILGIEYGMAIDMWSLGCILAEMYTGVPLFAGENEHEQLACIMEVMGVPPRAVLGVATAAGGELNCTRRKVFFHQDLQPRLQPNSKGKVRRPGQRTLEQAVKYVPQRALNTSTSTRQPLQQLAVSMMSAQ